MSIVQALTPHAHVPAVHLQSAPVQSFPVHDAQVHLQQSPLQPASHLHRGPQIQFSAQMGGGDQRITVTPLKTTPIIPNNAHHTCTHAFRHRLPVVAMENQFPIDSEDVLSPYW